MITSWGNSFGQQRGEGSKRDRVMLISFVSLLYFCFILARGNRDLVAPFVYILKESPAPLWGARAFRTKASKVYLELPSLFPSLSCHRKALAGQMESAFKLSGFVRPKIRFQSLTLPCIDPSVSSSGS